MHRDARDTGWITRTPITHRGYHDLNRKIWENTSSAFARSIDAGFAIECDLQLAGDNVPVVFHDYEIKRLCGIEGSVRDLTSDAMTQLTVGGTGDHVQTFSAFLEQVHGQVGLVIELKARNDDYIDVYADAVLNELAGYEGEACVMSFNAKLVRALIERGSRWPLGLVAAEFNEADRRRNRESEKLPFDFLSFCVDHLPSQFVEDMRARQLPVITWTVRDAAGRAATERYADQMTFEGFDPRDLSA